MRIRPMTELPTENDLSMMGEVLLCYKHIGIGYMTAVPRSHRWFKGEFTQSDIDSRIKVYGWLPCSRSKSLLNEFESLSQPNINIPINSPPSEQKRKIRIIDTEIEKG